ncbi:phospholipid-translocating ATPase [Dendrothele bispora CBS 962.96]|uniref:Phospholipid-transporting ATPase n=1 Tax=Dendrothele bispora (strain CBS 962.96) TaxID=1314807 RepID=A0A4S8MM73_DENBC|nr:phospholipid-translocating ATPase [Dendrothele bispora CBS 962.96]
MAPTPPPNPFVAFYRRVKSFSVEDLFSRKREPGPPRTVAVNHPLPEHYLDHKGRVKREYVYSSNQVISSKYTIITFVPRNLLEQFRRIANIYFLAIAIVQFFPKFSTISPGVVILPLIIIIVLTACKDGYEDFRRHQADKFVNQSSVKVLSGGNWINPNAMQGKSKTFIRGIIPKRRKRPPTVDSTPVEDKLNSLPDETELEEPDDDYDYDQPKRNGPHWQSTLWEDLRVGDFVKIMDNQPIPADILICATSDEENVAYVETKGLDGETNLKSRNAITALTHIRSALDCANTANSFSVSLDRPEVNMYRLNGSVKVGEKMSSVDLQTCLLRGTVLKNTNWVIGVVLFTGEDTKVVMNAGGTPSKRSRVERQMNPQVLINLALIAVMSIVCAVADSSLEKYYYPRGAPWLYADNQSDDNPSVNGAITWVFALLTFQTLVPISLYLSIEVVRTLQSAWIYFDKDICYEKNGQATQARSWNLSDDLGQIEYIFSDKTGTLTQNLMVFRQCSIGGKAYRGDPEILGDGDESRYKVSDSIELEKAKQKEFGGIHRPSNSSSKFGLDSTTSPTTTTREAGATAVTDDVAHFKDSVLTSDIEAAISEDPDPESINHFRNLNGFFTVLGLCHTVLTAVDPDTGVIQYKAQSPDEAALVQAAADVGYVFLGRDKETLSLKTPGSDVPERYELLTVLEFTSARKRMSVILRKLDEGDGRIFLLSKGADNVIFERLRSGSEELKKMTENHLSEFANEGLRTLTLAYKVLSEDEYHTFNERYHEASVAIDDREGKIEAVSDEIERNLRLLGATAIEDRLQDGVPEAIADLKRAGIKIWVATGDKLETAIAIGRSTNLVAPDSNIIIVRGGNRPVAQQLAGALTQFFPEHSEQSVPPRPSMQSRRSSRRASWMHALQRVDTGVSSIVGEGNGDRPGGFILVVDGAALLDALDNEENKALLLRLGTLCEGVICCRVSPLQKALIVKLVKDGLKAMTLAIGDGANDVSMIQAADVGVGISGEEGLQAVNSSDYAIAQFRFLKKLLLVHGHWSFARNGTMILNFFYKNVVPTGVLWWFQIFCGWSATFVFDYSYILFWNSIWTIAPVVGLGLFDRILDYRVLMELPELYHFGRERYWFSFRDFFIYMLDGIYQSVILYFFIMYTYTTTSARSDGYDVGLYEWSTTAAVAAVMVADIFTGMTAAAWTWWLVFAVFIGIAIVWAYTMIYSALSPGYEWTWMYGLYYFLCTSAYFWLGLLLVFVLSLAPRLMAKTYKSVFAPDDIDIIRYVHKTDPYRDLSAEAHPEPQIAMGFDHEMKQRRRSSRISSHAEQQRMASRRSSMRSISQRSIATIERPPPVFTDLRTASRTDMSTGMVSVERGFDFATEEDGPAMRRIQTNLSERRSSRLFESNPNPEPRRKGKGSLFSLRRKKKRPSE